MRTPPANRPPDNIWFRLLVPAGFLFCATALSWVMSSFGDQRAPISRLLSRYAVWAILVESIAIVAFAILAMTVDRRQSLKNKAAISGSAPPGEPEARGTLWVSRSDRRGRDSERSQNGIFSPDRGDID